MYLDVGYTGGLLGEVSPVGFRAVLVRQLKRELPPPRIRTSGRAGRVRVLRVLEVRHGTRRQFLRHRDRRVQGFLIGRRYWLHLRTKHGPGEAQSARANRKKEQNVAAYTSNYTRGGGSALKARLLRARL